MATATQHPGSACCDPAQDLAGWIARQRARIAIDHRWARVLSMRGRRLRRASIAAQVRGDRDRSERSDREALMCSGRAMAIYQSTLISEGQVDRVEEAHRWRLDGTR